MPRSGRRAGEFLLGQHAGSPRGHERCPGRLGPHLGRQGSNGRRRVVHAHLFAQVVCVSGVSAQMIVLAGESE
jgi:hypothetical protein